MNFPPLRSLCSWIARATSSLPLPDSPVTRTEPETRASAFTLSRKLCITSLFPIMLGIAARTGERSHVFFIRWLREAHLLERTLMFFDPAEIRNLIHMATRRTGTPVHDEDLEQDVALHALEAFRRL